MKTTQSDSEFNLMVEKAIHKNVITRYECQKIMTLSGQDLKLEAHEEQLLCHLQGLMGNHLRKAPATSIVGSLYAKRDAYETKRFEKNRVRQENFAWTRAQEK